MYAAYMKHKSTLYASIATNDVLVKYDDKNTVDQEVSLVWMNLAYALKADVIKKYRDCYTEVKPAEDRLYERFAWTEWCVWQRIFEGIEKNKNDVFNTSASSSSSEMVGVRGMKRLLAMEESIDNWTVPETVDNSLTINDIDINKEFFKYQVEALSVFQKDKFFCWRNDLQKLMALSSIVFLDGVHGMLDFLSVDVSRALNTFILSSLGSAFVMQTEARRDLEDILLSYKKKYESWDAIKKIANLHEKYKSDAAVLCIMETILAL
ncbi:hypothetical protein CU098_008446 [Rhizopus stolonifer]|uniref:Uncharacterized protein n=1 Tax=Rhizopus stolonifer TaxID=4846 RepID=A0A367KM51_RHIST|nr:hypothetical protein CU098_008446 [Rhizopus stolonifer]